MCSLIASTCLPCVCGDGPRNFRTREKKEMLATTVSIHVDKTSMKIAKTLSTINPPGSEIFGLVRRGGAISGAALSLANGVLVDAINGCFRRLPSSYRLTAKEG